MRPQTERSTRHLLWFLLLAAAALTATALMSARDASAATPLELDAAGFPIPKGDTLNDFADVVSEGDTGRIRKRLSEVEGSSGVEITVVTLKSLSDVPASGGRSFEEFATALFNAWGVGDRSRNNGVMLLVAVEDNSARIELGGGYPSAYDSRMQRVMDEDILPFFKEEEYSRGISQGVDGIVHEVTRPMSFWERWGLPLVIGILILALLIIGVSLIRSGKKGWGWAAIAAAGALLVLLLSLLGKKKSDDDSFGGGSSSGGGATGKW